MPKTVEAVVDEKGHIRLLESLPLYARQRILVTVLEEDVKNEPKPQVNETALLSEEALAEDWNRKEEEDAWSYLQPDQ
jgi:hypothetical protein